MWERGRVGWYSIAGAFKGIGQVPLLNWVVKNRIYILKIILFIDSKLYLCIPHIYII